MQKKIAKICANYAKHAISKKLNVRIQKKILKYQVGKKYQQLYKQNMSKIYDKKAKIMQKITTNMQKYSKKYAEIMQKICRIMQKMQKLCNKYAEIYTEICKKYAKII